MEQQIHISRLGAQVLKDGEISRLKEQLALAVKALQEIHTGSSVTGRWIDVVNGEAVGHDPKGPDGGFYDRDDPPEGYNEGGPMGISVPDESALIAADWESYDAEEQAQWVSTCADTAARALAALGVPVETE